MLNFDRRRLNWFKLFAADSLLYRMFQAIAPLYLIGCFIKFVSGLGRTISPFLLLSRLEFLWTNMSLIEFYGVVSFSAFEAEFR